MGVCILGRGRTMTPHTKWGNNSPYGGWSAEGYHFRGLLVFIFIPFLTFRERLQPTPLNRFWRVIPHMTCFRPTYTLFEMAFETQNLFTLFPKNSPLKVIFIPASSPRAQQVVSGENDRSTTMTILYAYILYFIIYTQQGPN